MAAALNALARELRPTIGLKVQVEAPPASPPPEVGRFLVHAARARLFDASRHADTPQAWLNLSGRGASWTLLVHGSPRRDEPLRAARAGRRRELAEVLGPRKLAWEADGGLPGEARDPERPPPGAERLLPAQGRTTAKSTKGSRRTRIDLPRIPIT